MFLQLTRYVLMVQVLQNLSASVKRKYHQTLNTLAVAEAATMPTYDEMKSSTYRYGVLRAGCFHITLDSVKCVLAFLAEHDYVKFGYCRAP